MGFEGKLLLSEKMPDVILQQKIGRKVRNTDSRHLVLMDSRDRGDQWTLIFEL